MLDLIKMLDADVLLGTKKCTQFCHIPHEQMYAESKGNELLLGRLLAKNNKDRNIALYLLTFPYCPCLVTGYTVSVLKRLRLYLCPQAICATKVGYFFFSPPADACWTAGLQ